MGAFIGHPGNPKAGSRRQRSFSMATAQGEVRLARRLIVRVIPIRPVSRHFSSLFAGSVARLAVMVRASRFSRPSN